MKIHVSTTSNPMTNFTCTFAVGKFTFWRLNHTSQIPKLEWNPWTLKHWNHSVRQTNGKELVHPSILTPCSMAEIIFKFSLSTTQQTFLYCIKQTFIPWQDIFKRFLSNWHNCEYFMSQISPFLFSSYSCYHFPIAKYRYSYCKPGSWEGCHKLQFLHSMHDVKIWLMQSSFTVQN